MLRQRHNMAECGAGAAGICRSLEVVNRVATALELARTPLSRWSIGTVPMIAPHRAYLTEPAPMRFEIARAIAVDAADDADERRWPRWLETAVTALTGL